jgi:DNA-binding response OmpR family regulator
MYSLLVVEDSPDFQMMIQRVLNGPSFRLKCVETATDAINVLGRESFDLVLLDIVLPDGDGYRVCTHMQKEERMRNTPVFFLTGKTDVYDKVLAFSLGADDYIVKPFDPLELKARIEARFGRRSVYRNVPSGAIEDQSGFSKSIRLG